MIYLQNIGFVMNFCSYKLVTSLMLKLFWKFEFHIRYSEKALH